MSIVGTFNDITEKLTGTRPRVRSLTGAIDALNDALAGSDQKQAKTLEGAIRLLGEHISLGGNGGNNSEYNITCHSYMDGTVYVYEIDLQTMQRIGEPLTTAAPGSFLMAFGEANEDGWTLDSLAVHCDDERAEVNRLYIPTEAEFFIMPANDIIVEGHFGEGGVN